MSVIKYAGFGVAAGLAGTIFAVVGAESNQSKAEVVSPAKVSEAPVAVQAPKPVTVKKPAPVKVEPSVEMFKLGRLGNAEPHLCAKRPEFHLAISEIVKSAIDDPDSFRPGSLLMYKEKVHIDFRMKNKFGGYVSYLSIMDVDLKTCSLKGQFVAIPGRIGRPSL